MKKTVCTVQIKGIGQADASGFRRLAMDLEPGADPRVESMIFAAKISQELWEQCCADLKPDDFCVIELGPYESGQQEICSIRRVDRRTTHAEGKSAH